MHPPRRYDDFVEREAAGSRTRRHWILLSCLAALILILSGSLGFGLSRGVWTIPETVRDHLPSKLAEWLSPAEPVRATAPTTNLKDYAFDLTNTKGGQGEAILSVRLVNTLSGKPISGAVIFARRLDMAPEGMPTMTAELQAMPSSEAGAYRFKTNLTMQGKWRLSLAAKIQGERGTVRNQLVFEAMP